MASRIDLQEKLEMLLGSKNVYFQPPETLSMSYPCIKYSRDRIKKDNADSTAYHITKGYELIVISKRPDDKVIDKLLELPYCSYGRHYIVDGLHHDTFTLYF